MTRAIHDSFIMLPLTVLAVVGAAFARADEILSEDVGTLTWKYTVTNGAARVYGGHMQTAIGWTSGAVVIPDTLAGLPVKAIGSYAFFQLGQMTSLEIPDSVESIEFYACRDCTNLVTAMLPSNLTTMGNGVFSNCQKLEVGYIPDSVTSMGRDTFWGCKSMGSVKFSSQVRDLGAMTCFDCDSLTEVSIPDCVTNIGVSAFLHCDNLRLVTLPKGEVTFGNYAFNSCPSLEVVDVSSGFIDFDNAFHNCPSLTTARIRQDILYVDPASFVGCPTLTAISVEDGNSAYKSVGGVLYDATGRELVAWPAALQPVVIPVEVERIGDYAFGWTYDKSAIPIPEGVEVSEHAFADPPPEEPEEPEYPFDPPVPESPREGVYIYRDCFTIVPGQIPHLSCIVPGLTDINYAIGKFETNNWEVTWHGGGTRSRFVQAQPGEHKIVDSVFTNQLLTITGTAYPFVFEFAHWYKQGASGTTWYGYVSLGLDENAELVILESAICNSLGFLTVVGTPNPVLPPDLKTIDHGDWLELAGNCVKPDTEGWIAIPSAIDGKPIRAIGRFAFAECRSITHITMPDTIGSIGDCAFSYCMSLTALDIPKSVTNVGERVVNGCDALGEVRIGSGIASIPRIAFVSSGMTNLVMSVGTTNIEEYAFALNTRLKSVTIPQSMERIHSLAFNGCSALTAVSVPYATIVEDGAFPSGCAITRYGPRIRTYVTSMLDVETESALMLTLDWRVYQSKELVEFMPACPPYVEECEADTAPIACAHLGISPFTIWSEDGKDYIETYYKMPTVEFVGIDPESRTITGRVVPAEGTHIVSAPLDRAFGFHRIYRDDDGAMLNGLDWGREMYYGYPGFELDTSCYVESNGLFRITFPEEVLLEKHPQPAHLFRIRLSDKAGGLW